MKLPRASSAVLIVVAAVLVVAWLGARSQGEHFPAGSSRSAQPDGTLALYVWASDLGLRSSRLDRPTAPAAGAGLLLVVQPTEALNPAVLQAQVGAGETLVLAGDSLALRTMLPALGVTLEPTQPVFTATEPSTRADLSMLARNRVRADGATPLLTAPNGDWLALRKPLGSGSLIIIATAYPLTNAGLRDPDTARFVFRTLLGSQAPSTVVAFDESHYGGLAVADPADGIVEHLLFTTPAGRGVLLAAALVFLYLLFGSRRLGPALPGVNPGEHSRTMYEHVQMLAGLYRRSRQLRFARQYFARKLAHDAARGLGLDPRSAEDPEVFALELAARNRSDAGQDSRLAHAITRVASARSEADLIAAVRIAETAASALPRAGTLR